MINFYQEWKDEKEAEEKPKLKPKGKLQCTLCGKKLLNEGRLKQHFRDAHGDVGLWDDYQSTIKILEQEKKRVFLETMKKVTNDRVQKINNSRVC